MAESESDPRPDQPTTDDGEQTAPALSPARIPHGQMVRVYNDTKETLAILDRENYRRPALTKPKNDIIQYLDELNDGTRLEVVGQRYPEYDHRATVDSKGGRP